jgi:hypothetical protein
VARLGSRGQLDQDQPARAVHPDPLAVDAHRHKRPARVTSTMSCGRIWLDGVPNGLAGRFFGVERGRQP